MSPTRTAGLPSRAQRLEALANESFEVIVVGGGITGAGIALDLALRGVRTALVERGDWAGSTSSASSRLVHGGLRYLEQFELSLVRESCLERALLLDNAAGLVWPERFVFPVHRGDRVSLWKMQAGLWLYTALSIPRALGRPGRLSARQSQLAIPGLLAEGLRGSGLYLDSATDDARLTLAVVRAASAAGATCVSRCEALAIEPTGAVELRDTEPLGSEERWSLNAKAVVLAAGPATDALRARVVSGPQANPDAPARPWIQPTRGSHIVLPRTALPTDGAVIFSSSVDGRVMFLIPWPRHTIVGTTDLDARADLAPRATRAEVRYLLDSANGLVPKARLTEQHVLSTWSGLRPLLAAVGEDPSQRSREERIEQQGAIWSIAGGKLTGYRSMAENLCSRLVRAHELGTDRGRHSPTRTHRLPGALAKRSQRPAWSHLDADPRAPLLIAWERRYAGESAAVREFVNSVPDGQRELNVETLTGELDWSVAHEDTLSLVDFCFRRTDLGLDPSATRASAEQLADRMLRLASWSPQRRAAELVELESELALREAWRSDPQ